MILSEHTRRWAEVRLYHFCQDTYNFRHKSIDIMEMAEAIAKYGGADVKTIKNVITRMLNDTYFQATERETILLAHLHNRRAVDIANYIGISRQSVHKFIRTNLETFTPIPRCEIREDQEIIKFLNALDSLKGIGI